MSISNPLIHLLTILLLAIVALALGDLTFDLWSGVHISHVIAEMVLSVLAISGLVFLRRETIALSADRESLRMKVAAAKESATLWEGEVARYRQGVSSAIDTQFAKWNFSEAEKDVAKLLLKGVGLKDIATVRGTSEKTVRHQAQALYNKSGLSGRAELAAYFLDALVDVQM